MNKVNQKIFEQLSYGDVAFFSKVQFADGSWDTNGHYVIILDNNKNAVDFFQLEKVTGKLNAFAIETSGGTIEDKVRYIHSILGKVKTDKPQYLSNIRLDWNNCKDIRLPKEISAVECCDIIQVEERYFDRYWGTIKPERIEYYVTIYNDDQHNDTDQEIKDFNSLRLDNKLKTLNEDMQIISNYIYRYENITFDFKYNSVDECAGYIVVNYIDETIKYYFAYNYSNETLVILDENNNVAFMYALDTEEIIENKLFENDFSQYFIKCFEDVLYNFDCDFAKDNVLDFDSYE